jgi:ferric-dicitrate binding protein FerR (iron transport regulator)
MKTLYSIEKWDLIAKYYANECDQKEIEELDNWISENEEHKKIFIQVKQDLEILNINNSMNKINVDSAWDKVKNRIEEADEKESIAMHSTTGFQFKSVLKYAAMLILIVGIGFITNKIYQSTNGKLNTEYAAIDEQGKEIILPDGSIVFLNSESTIFFEKTFAHNERRVILEGEAFFDVTKNPDKPFIIETKSAEVKVLGTSFNVNANLPNKEVEVFVKTGLVMLSDVDDLNNKILIEPGKIGLLKNKDLSKEENTDLNKISWKTKEIVFQEDNISNVINTLNKVYNTNISCSDQKVLDLKYTSTFRNQEIDSILNVICMTLDLKVDYIDNQINLIKHNN